MLYLNQSSYSLNHAKLIQCHVFSNCICEKLWLICWQCPYFVDMLFEFDLYHYDGNHKLFFFFFFFFIKKGYIGKFILFK
jgi:hypothetical protein